MIRPLRHREGSAMISPLMFLFFLSVLLLIYLFLCRLKAAQIYTELEDTVTVSCQAVCRSDRYIPGAYHWNRADVVFTTSSKEESDYYETEPARATMLAAELAYNRMDDLLLVNFPPTVMGYQVEKFRVVNIISGKAYAYECISGLSSAWMTAEEESYIEIQITVFLELPAFGKTDWKKEDKVKLRED